MFSIAWRAQSGGSLHNIAQPLSCRRAGWRPSEYTSFPFVVRGDNLSEAICKRHRARRHFSHRRRQRPRSHTLRGIPILCLYNKTPLVAISADLCQYSLLPHSHRSRQAVQCLQPRLIRQQNIPQHSRRPRPVLASMRLIVHGRRPDAPARPVQQQNLFIAIPTGLGWFPLPCIPSFTADSPTRPVRTARQQRLPAAN